MDDDEILAMDLDELIKRFKELGCWTYRSSNIDKVMVVTMIAQAVEKIAYAKGFKCGKSIGSHAAYSHFLKHGHWEDEINIYNEAKHGRWCQMAGQYEHNLTGYRCSNCNYIDVVPLHDTNKFCANCGARMDGGGK